MQCREVWWRVPGSAFFLQHESISAKTLAYMPLSSSHSLQIIQRLQRILRQWHPATSHSKLHSLQAVTEPQRYERVIVSNEWRGSTAITHCTKRFWHLPLALNAATAALSTTVCRNKWVKMCSLTIPKRCYQFQVEDRGCSGKLCTLQEWNLLEVSNHSGEQNKRVSKWSFSSLSSLPVLSVSFPLPSFFPLPFLLKAQGKHSESIYEAIITGTLVFEVSKSFSVFSLYFKLKSFLLLKGC